MKHKHLGAAALAAAFIAAGTPASAAPFTADYVFGDSLSDRGNLAAALGHNFPSPPFFHDSFTNGPTAVQVMAQQLGLSADPSLFVTGFKNAIGYTAGGSNYAVAGATAGSYNSEGVAGANLANQVGAYFALTGKIADPNALYTVFIGGNDVRTSAHNGTAGAGGTVVFDPNYITAGITAETTAISSLLAAGAKNLLVVNVPNVGAIPEFTLGFPNQVDAATKASVAYNQQLGLSVAGIASANAGANIKLFDLYTFNNAFLANAASVGITNISTPCYLNTGAELASPPAPLQINPACGAIDPATGQAANIGSFQYWDAIHPTSKEQAAIGNVLYAFEVPEPASLALLGIGIAAVGVIRRRVA